MNQCEYFILGMMLGLAVALYFFANREEKIEKIIAQDKKIFSTKKLDNIMENVVEKIKLKIKEVKRELTEEEKNEIIAECCKEKVEGNK